MKRLGALVLSVVLVIAALWIRGRLDGKSDGGGQAAQNRITCATEVYRACELLVQEDPDLRITTEDAGDTTARLATLGPGEDPGFDVWLTTTPFADLARETTGSSGSSNPLGTSSPPLGHARLGFWVDQSRAATLESHCGGQVGWACLLSAVPNRWEAIGGDPAWGPLKPHIDEPSGSAGLLALGNAATVLAEPGADSLAIEENSAYIGAITGLARARVKETLGVGGGSQPDAGRGPGGGGHRRGPRIRGSPLRRRRDHPSTPHLPFAGGRCRGLRRAPSRRRPRSGEPDGTDRREGT